MNYFDEGIHINDNGTIEFDMNHFNQPTPLSIYLSDQINLENTSNHKN